MTSISKDINPVSRIRLAVGICFLILAVFDLLRGQPGTTSARWQWLYQIINTFGPHAMTFVEAVVGIIFIAWGLRKPSKNLNLTKEI